MGFFEFLRNNRNNSKYTYEDEFDEFNEFNEDDEIGQQYYLEVNKRNKTKNKRNK